LDGLVSDSDSGQLASPSDEYSISSIDRTTIHCLSRLVFRRARKRADDTDRQRREGDKLAVRMNSWIANSRYKPSATRSSAAMTTIVWTVSVAIV
jgi:hypothetical protein